MVPSEASVMPLSDSARLSSVAADGSVMISEAAVGMRADGSVPAAVCRVRDIAAAAREQRGA